jgi:hypothetical protein
MRHAEPVTLPERQRSPGVAPTLPGAGRLGHGFMLTNANCCATKLSIAVSCVEPHPAPLAKVAELLDNRQIKNNRAACASSLKNLIAINVLKN